MEQHIEPVISQAAHWTEYGLLGLMFLQMAAMTWFLLKQLAAAKKTKDPLTKQQIKEIIKDTLNESGLDQLIKNGTETVGDTREPKVWFDRWYVDERFKELADVLETLADTREGGNVAMLQAVKELKKIADKE